MQSPDSFRPPRVSWTKEAWYLLSGFHRTAVGEMPGIIITWYSISVTDESSVVQRLVQGSRGLGAVIAAIESEAEAIFEAFSHMRALRSDRQGDHGRASGQRNEPAPEGGGGQDGNRPEGGGQEGESSQQGEKSKTKEVDTWVSFKSFFNLSRYTCNKVQRCVTNQILVAQGTYF